MARRIGRAALAVAGIVVVAVFARPSSPDVAPPLEIERATPSPQRTTEPTTEPTEPTPEGTTETPEAEERWVTVHRLDPSSLVPLAEPVRLTRLRDDLLQSAVSPDGRYLAIVQQAAWPDRGSVLEIYLTEHLGSPLEVVEIPVAHGMIRFSEDSEELAWAGQDTAGELQIGGLALRGGTPEQRRFGDFPVTRELLAGGITPLGEGRVGLHGYAEPEEAPERSDTALERGPVRLLVADLSTGTYALDVVLPTAPGLVWADGDEATLLDMTAGVAWDAARDRVYVAHADRDAVLVVDLDTGDVVTELGADPVPDAVNQPEPAPADTHHQIRRRDAHLSPDGRRLYVSGIATLPFDASGDSQDGRAVELPLLLADLEAGELTAVEGVMGRVIAVSGDGERIAVLSGLGLPEDDEHLVRFLDGTSLEVRWEHNAEHLSDVSFTADGAHALVLSVVADSSRPRGRYLLDVLDATDGASAHTLELAEGLLEPHLHAGIVVQLDHEQIR